jgi:hypothetical protein
MYLPDAGSLPLPEAATGGVVVGAAPDGSQAEVLWCCYAWPSSRGNSGKRCFFINQAGDVLATKNTAAGQLYSGQGNPPGSLAAFSMGVATMGGTVAANRSGVDAGIWIVVN